MEIESVIAAQLETLFRENHVTLVHRGSVSSTHYYEPEEPQDSFEEYFVSGYGGITTRGSAVSRKKPCTYSAIARFSRVPQISRTLPLLPVFGS